MIAKPYALLVEDDPGIAQLIVAILAAREPKMRMEHVANGQEALDFLKSRGPYDGRDERAPSVLLLDLEMPRMSGLELLREIRNEPRLKHLPVVVMAGTHSDRKVERSYELGANAFVVKPVNYPQFAEFVRTLTSFWLTMNHAPRMSLAVHRS
jgi:two-component system response regulator